MIQHSTFTAAPARPASDHRHDMDLLPAAPDSSVLPLLLTIAMTLTLAMVLIILAATSVDVSILLDAGTFFRA